MSRLRNPAVILQILAVLFGIGATAAITVGAPYADTVVWTLPIFGALLLVGMFLDYSMDYIQHTKRV